MSDQQHHKSVLLSCIHGTLSPEASLRHSSEEKLSLLEVTEHYPLHLLEIVLDRTSTEAGAIRQLACVLLRQYVDTHWSNLAEKFVEPIPSERVKAIIRTNLPIGLSEPNSKIRNSLVQVISKVGHWDWPEVWPELLPILMSQLKDRKTAQGAMRVLGELAVELTDVHVVPIVPGLLGEMLRILEDQTDTYSPATKSKAVEIFRTCNGLIQSVSEVDKSVIKTILVPSLEPFLSQFVQILDSADPSVATRALKKNIVRTIGNLLYHWPRRMSPYLSVVLPPIWKLLTSCAPSFQAYLGRGADDSDDESEQQSAVGENEDFLDEDGQNSRTVEGVIYAVFELIQSVLDQPSMSSMVKSGLPDLMYYIIYYMQLPQERVESWISNPTQFVLDDEDDVNATYTLRVFAADLCTVACDTYPAESFSALGQAVERHLTLAPGQQLVDWKIQEACLFAVGSCGTRIVTTAVPGNTNGIQDSMTTPGSGVATTNGSGENSFNIHGFIQNIVLPGLESHDILLSGRCLVLGSNFCRVLTPDLISKFVQTAAAALNNPSSSVISKILALKSFNTFVEEAGQSQGNLTVKMALLSVLPTTLESIVHFATSQSVEILERCLESMDEILSLDEGFTGSVGNLVTTLVISSFIKFNSDPVICPTLECLVKTLCKNPQVVGILQERFTPTIISLLNSRSEDLGGAQGVAIDLLTAIVRGSPVPLSPILMSAFPAVVNCTSASEDHTILQNAGECLRAYTSVSPTQVYEFRDASGTSGLGHVVQLAVRLLDPNASEFSAMFVGKIVTTLIVRASEHLGDNLELLLRATLSKLQSADSLSVIQNLILVYCHLFNTQLEGTLNFLDNVPGPTGDSALHFVLTEWVLRQQNFFGRFDRRLSCIALCKLLEHGVSTKDPRLSSITIRGDPIIEPNAKSGGPRTRSASARIGGLATADKWTEIPLLVKIFKVLILELGSSLYEENESVSTDEDDDEEDEDEISGGGEGSPRKATAEDKENLLSAHGNLGDLPGIWDDCEYEEDQEDLRELLSTHPLYSVDLGEYLRTYLAGFSGHMYYPEFSQHLTPVETKTLVMAGIHSK